MSRLRLMVAIAVTFSLAIACSRELTRDQAADLISKHLKLPNPVGMKLQIGTIKMMGLESFDGFWQNDVHGKKLKRFADKGLVVRKNVSTEQARFMGIGAYQTAFVFDIQLTDEGSRYVLGAPEENQRRRYVTVRLCDEVLEVVTGMSKAGDGAMLVEFTIKNGNVTPFGEVEGVDLKARTPQRVYMRLYDDGWRVATM